VRCSVPPRRKYLGYFPPPFPPCLVDISNGKPGISLFSDGIVSFPPLLPLFSPRIIVVFPLRGGLFLLMFSWHLTAFPESEALLFSASPRHRSFQSPGCAFGNLHRAIVLNGKTLTQPLPSPPFPCHFFSLDPSKGVTRSRFRISSFSSPLPNSFPFSVLVEGIRTLTPLFSPEVIDAHGPPFFLSRLLLNKGI